MGVADVATSSGAYMEGSFEPSPEFAPYAILFRALAQAAGNGRDGVAAAGDGSAGEAARLRQHIDGLGLRATGPLPLPTSAAMEAVEIEGGSIRFRLAAPATGKSSL